MEFSKKEMYSFDLLEKIPLDHFLFHTYLRYTSKCITYVMFFSSKPKIYKKIPFNPVTEFRVYATTH